jgi:hypothetical protein
MPLLDLKTDLKSLKYGKDRPGGGNSGQPYIQNNISNPKDILGFDDGLIRGGAIGAAKASLNDTIRIGKWLKDFSKGPLWIVKQVGLQRSNPKLETLPGLGGFFGEPTRLYNLGLNTLAQVPVNAFGVHFDRHGLLPIQPASTKYLNVANRNNQGEGAPNNRLVKLKDKLLGSVSAPPSTTTNIFNNISNLLSKIGITLPKLGTNIYDYDGGPGSVYGIGRTLIRRRGNFTIENQDVTGNEWALKGAKEAGIGYRISGHSGGTIDGYTDASRRITNFTGVSNQTGSIFAPNKSFFLDKRGIASVFGGRRDNIPLGLDIGSETNTAKSYPYYGNTFNKNVKKYRAIFSISGKDTSQTNTSYNNSGIEYFNGNTTIKIKGNWADSNREERIGSGLTDRINLSPILKNVSSVITQDTINGSNIRDLVNLRILAINGDKPSEADLMAFRAYITQFSDSTDAKWNPVQYIGRGEEFYTYTGFGRKVQIGFKVATLSEKEMEPVYQKLNYLMSNLMPDYSNGLMRGPFVKMTVGNWFNNQDGILNSLSYTIPQDSPWEIAIDEPEGGSAKKLLVLPHIVEVALSFTPIGSQTKGVNKISSKSSTISHIAQNVNDYQYIK